MRINQKVNMGLPWNKVELTGNEVEDWVIVTNRMIRDGYFHVPSKYTSKTDELLRDCIRIHGGPPDLGKYHLNAFGERVLSASISPQQS